MSTKFISAQHRENLMESLISLETYYWRAARIPSIVTIESVFDALVETRRSLVRVRHWVASHQMISDAEARDIWTKRGVALMSVMRLMRELGIVPGTVLDGPRLAD